MCNRMGIWVRATSLVWYGLLLVCNANITFCSERKKYHLNLCIMQILSFAECIHRKKWSLTVSGGTLYCFFLSRSLLVKLVQQDFLLIILLTSLRFHHFLYTGCAWKMTPSLHQPSPCVSFVLPPQATWFFCLSFMPALSYQSCLSHLICDKYELLPTPFA